MGKLSAKSLPGYMKEENPHNISNIFFLKNCPKIICECTGYLLMKLILTVDTNTNNVALPSWVFFLILSKYGGGALNINGGVYRSPKYIDNGGN